MKNKEQKRIYKIIRTATLTSWILRTITLINGLVTLPIVVSRLGKTEYGIWVLIGQSISFFALADLGIGNAVGRYVAKYRGLKDNISFNKLLSTVVFLMLGFMLVVAGIILISAPHVIKFLNIQSKYYDITKIIFIISGISLALQFPLRIGMGILTGHQYYGPHAVGKIAGSVLNIIGILILFFIDKIDLFYLSLNSAFAAVFSYALLFFTAWRLTRPWQIRLNLFSFTMVKNVMGLGSSALLITFSNLLYRSGLGVLVGKYISVEAVAVYGIALTIIENVHPLISSFSTPFSTIASEYQARKQIHYIREATHKVMSITFSLSMCIVMGCLVYGESIIRFFVRSKTWTALDFTDSGHILMIMSIGLAVGLPQVISRSTLQGIGKHWQASYGFIISSILSVAAAAVLMRLNTGVVGTAVGWSLCWILQGTFFYPYFISRCFKESIIKMFLNNYYQGIIIGLIMFIIVNSIYYLIPPVSSLRLITGLILSIGLGGMMILIFYLPKKIWKKKFGF